MQFNQDIKNNKLPSPSNQRSKIIKVNNFLGAMGKDLDEFLTSQKY